MKNKTVLFGICGSFCNHAAIIEELKKLCIHNDVEVIVSQNVLQMNTRFHSASTFIDELEAITHIFEELEGNEGILVASKIADRVGITRSVIVNALRKFESAGVIESRSSGMKGTYIKIVNDVIFDELDKVRNNY